jgi:hypothetical protein
MLMGTFGVTVYSGLGASPLRMVLVHIVPNILAPLFILLAMDIPGAITVTGGLALGMLLSTSRRARAAPTSCARGSPPRAGG